MDALTRVRIRGFRSLRDVDLEVRPLTVLVGANGSGKSNLVAFFRLLNFAMSEALQTFVARAGGASALLHYGPKHTPTLQATLSFEHDNGPSRYEVTLGFAAPDRLAYLSETLWFHRSGDPKPFEAHPVPRGLESALPPLAAASGSPMQSKVAKVFCARLRSLVVYHFHDTSERSHIRLHQDLDRSRWLQGDGGNLAPFLRMLRDSHPGHYERIVDTVRLILPFLHGFVLEPEGENGQRILLRWRDGDPEYEFGPHHLSDGSLRAIALVTALLQPEALMPAALLFDEPELGLHPEAIGIVGRLLRAAAAERRVIVATQSPRLLAEFEPNDVVIVDRAESETGQAETTLRRLDAADLREWLDDFDLGTLFERNITGGAPQ